MNYQRYLIGLILIGFLVGCGNVGFQLNVLPPNEATATAQASVVPPPPPTTQALSFIEVKIVADADNYWTPGPAPGVSFWDCNAVGHPSEPILKVANEEDEIATLCRMIVGLNFPLYEIPKEAEILSAHLNLYVEGANTNPYSYDHEMVIRTPPEPFREDDRVGVAWCSGLDFSNPYFVGQNVGWESWNITDIITELHSDESINDQICLELGNGVGYRIFTSREGAQDQRPYLDIVYRP